VHAHHREEALVNEGGLPVKQEVLSLAEGDVVVRWPVSLSPRSRRQFKAWLAMLAHELRESRLPREATTDDPPRALRVAGRVALR
jgi:hypothetical protein